MFKSINYCKNVEVELTSFTIQLKRIIAKILNRLSFWKKLKQFPLQENRHINIKLWTSKFTKALLLDFTVWNDSAQISCCVEVNQFLQKLKVHS